MMLRLFTFCILFSINALAQDSYPELQDIEKEFRNFNFPEVIQLADSLILKDQSFDTTARIELLRMKGIAEYSLKQQYQAHDTFLGILVLKNTYTMDPVDTSPKILEFFNLIKKSFNSYPRYTTGPSNQSTETMYVSDTYQPDLKATITRSLLVPGWGHYYAGQKHRANWLLAGALITMPASFYFTWDSFKKENSYLSETDPSKIEGLYSRYNRAYKFRNGFLSAYLALWIYSQFDVLSHKNFFIAITSESSLITPYILSFQISL